jgi:hypothetical protein
LNAEAPQLERFEDAEVAMERFVDAERKHREKDDGRGVVLLIAEDEETLKATHTHYFRSAAELLDAARS